MDGRTLSRFLSHDASPRAQFIKYGLCGGAAVAVQMLVFFLLAWLLIPALGRDEFLVRLLGLTVEPLSDAVRARHAMINNGLAFLVSNLAAYLMDIAWVFKSGRRYPPVDSLLSRTGLIGRERLRRWTHRAVEIALFYGVSGLSVALGTAAMGFLIQTFACSTTLAFAAQIAISVIINYVLRKFLIFQG